MLKQSPGILKNQEPERVTKPYWGYFKQVVYTAIIITVIVYIVRTNLSKIGSEKSQEVSILKHTELDYNITDGMLYDLMPLHFFTTFNKAEVIKRMECLVNNKKLECNFYEERKCEVLGIKSPGYDECMLAEYDKMGFDLESFCLKHYDASSYKVWTSAE